VKPARAPIVVLTAIGVPSWHTLGTTRDEGGDGGRGGLG
jgi:hypothetical protein